MTSERISQALLLDEPGLDSLPYVFISASWSRFVRMETNHCCAYGSQEQPGPWRHSAVNTEWMEDTPCIITLKPNKSIECLVLS